MEFTKLNRRFSKVIRLTHSFMIIMPIYWCREVGLKKGDYLQLDINPEGDLIIMRPPIKKE